jgi:hypothetical protein
MSEPSSLYARIRLTESALAAFYASAPALPSQFDDWRPWLASKHYYGEIKDAEIQQMTQSEAASVGEMLALWLQQPIPGPSQVHYDPLTQTWTLGLLECSENYKDFILVLSWLRAIALFKDLPGDDFIVIHPYIWGGPPEAYVVVTLGSSTLRDDVPPTLLAEVNAGLQRIYDTLASAYSDNEL